ncbi:hypothetical protein MNV49_003595 [Pseudohyphozyma bogoriensis]|nr:hypothetical protein MNV49_003595 [Pseudohyphozyma bogoriensis]
MHLTYLPQRGRADPILLLLLDSSTQFTHSTLAYAEWDALKSSGQAVAPEYPFSKLPTFRFGHGARGGNDTTLAETAAILGFLEKKLAPVGTTASPPDATARLTMILSSSLELLAHLLALTSTTTTSPPPSFLLPPHRSALLTTITTYLTSLEHHLSSSFFPPLFSDPLPLAQPGTNLTPAAATAVTVISFVQDLFPSELGGGNGGGMEEQFPKCEELRREVEGRDKIREWIEGGRGGFEGVWGRSEYATKEWFDECDKKAKEMV